MPTTLAEKRARQAETIKSARAIQQAAQTENRSFTADERAATEKLLAEHDQLAAEIEADEADLALASRVENLAGALDKSAGRRVNAAASKPQHKREAHELDPKGGFANETEFFQAVMASATGGRNDDRLRQFTTVGSDEHSTQDFNRGGFLIPTGFIASPLMLSPEADPTAGRTTSVPMSAPVVEIPARTDKDHSTSVSGGLTVGRRAETGAFSSSRISGERVKLEAFSLTGLTYATEEVIERSPGTFMALLQQGFRDEFASKILREKLRGTGVGEYLGVLNAPCLVTQAAEGGQSADTINFANLVKMRSRCWRYGSAIWLANHDTIPQLATITNGSSSYPSYMPSAREDMPDVLFGRPIFFSEYASKLGDVGDLILGVWSEYLEGVYMPLRQAESMHVRFEYHERTFKFWVENCGSPWWRTALTPHKSAATLSPFITLAAR